MSAAAARVLVVDDEAPLAQLVARYLASDGFETTVVGDGLSAVQRARELRPDVVILDVGLPGLDGLEVCRQLRTFTNCYVLMLTARSDEIDKLIGLSVGADDYLTKPFSPRELVARVRVMLRRPRTPVGGAVLTFGALSVDLAAREIHLAGAEIALTRTEFDILAVLAAQPKVVFTRRQLIEMVWDDNWVGDEHLVDVHIGHLRRKLNDDADDPQFLRTVRGVGYRMGSGS